MPEPVFKLPPREAYKCRFCDKTYATRIGVNQHERNHHREQVAVSPRFEYGPLVREVMRRMRLRLIELDPVPAVELKAIAELCFMTAIADDYHDRGLDAGSDARWTKIAETYGVRREDPTFSRASLDLLMARDDLNEAERHVFQEVEKSLSDLLDRDARNVMTVMIGQPFEGNHRKVRL